MCTEGSAGILYSMAKIKTLGAGLGISSLNWQYCSNIKLFFAQSLGVAKLWELFSLYHV